MADEKDKQDKEPPAAKKPAAKKPAAEKKPAAAKKPAAKPRARKAAAAKAEPAEQKTTAEAKETTTEPKPARKPAARRSAAKKPAPKDKAPAKAESPKAEPARKPALPQRPLVRAQAKYVRSSARKARLVMDHVRGRPVADARALLRHSPRGVARDVERLLNSAIANAENNHDLVGDDLYVKEIYADEGPTLRRFRPRAQGRATRIRKRTSHLTVGLSTKET